MPTYEYACTQCGQHIEVFQRVSEERLTTCGACGGTLRKVFHPAGILFKGSGFYSTDSRSKSKTGAGTPEPSTSSGSKPEAKSDGDTGGEPKPAAAKPKEKTA